MSIIKKIDKQKTHIKNFIFYDFENTILVKNKFQRVRSDFSFSLKFFTLYGLQLGGHVQLLDQTTTSVAYGIRNFNSVIDINKTVLELLKISKILEGLGMRRSVLYFVNNIRSLRSSLFYSFQFYNRHLFFPTGMEIISYFRTLKFLKMSRKKRKKLKNVFGFRRYSFFRSGISLLKKFFISSKWPFGFLSNNSGFKQFFCNVYHDEVKVGKFINAFEEKVDKFIDYLPLLPHYGFIGDHRLNFWVVNEFRCAQVPHNSLIDNTTNKACFTMYGVPGNGCSLDTSMFFLIIMISNYLLGYNEQIYKFNLKPEIYVSPNYHIFFKKYDSLVKHSSIKTSYEISCSALKTAFVKYFIIIEFIFSFVVISFLILVYGVFCFIFLFVFYLGLYSILIWLHLLDLSFWKEIVSYFSILIILTFFLCIFLFLKDETLFYFDEYVSSLKLEKIKILEKKIDFLKRESLNLDKKIELLKENTGYTKRIIKYIRSFF